MAIYKIVTLPHAVLRKPADEVTEFDDNLRMLINDMYETMYEADGVGLAAPQIGISKQIAVIDVTPDKTGKFCLINPELIESTGSKEMTEGCLSVPGCWDVVTRATQVRFRALDEHGQPYEREAEGLLAECVQHEIDHLRGKLYIDLLSPLKRKRAHQKMEKFLRVKEKRSK